MTESPEIVIRQALPVDIPAIEMLIHASVRGLQQGDYTQIQIERALTHVYGVDTQLIEDGTYLVAQSAARTSSAIGQDPAAGGESQVIACGGWSKRKTLFGGDQCAAREDALLDPKTDAAKIRAFFVHPEWARRGIGSLLLEACEAAATAAGFCRLEMGSTLTGVPFYRARGYVELEEYEVPLGDGVSLPIVRMEKRTSVTKH